MKWISYILTWIIIVFGISAFFCIFLSGYLTVYYSLQLPELTGKLLLLIWVFIVFITCLGLYLYIGAIGKKQNLGGYKFPLWIPCLNQLAAAVVYIVIAYHTRFIDYFYFTTVFLRFAVKEQWHGTITSANEIDWMIGMTVAHALLYSCVALFAYMRERYLQHRRYEIGMSHRNA